MHVTKTKRERLRRHVEEMNGFLYKEKYTFSRIDIEMPS